MYKRNFGQGYENIPDISDCFRIRFYSDNGTSIDIFRQTAKVCRIENGIHFFCNRK